MKLSETPPELKGFRIDYINKRWKQLSELQHDSAQEALKYLFLTNSGGAATTLAFIGSVGVNKIGWEAKFALAFFVVGIVLAGFCRANEFYHMKGLFDQWRALVDEFFLNKKSWEEITKADKDMVNGNYFAEKLPWAAFICFMVGCVIGSIALF
jgi:hypothetical protein